MIMHAYMKGTTDGKGGEEVMDSQSNMVCLLLSYCGHVLKGVIVVSYYSKADKAAVMFRRFEEAGVVGQM